MNKLEEARIEIDEIDQKFVELFERRMEIVTKVAQYKKENSMPIFDEKRENAVIEKNVKRLKNKELETEYVSFIRNLMDVSKLYQRKNIYGKQIAYQGVEGAFSHIAACNLFDGANFKNYATFAGVMDAILNDEVDCGVLPIENSTNGEVGEVMDGLFKRKDLFINAYYDLKVDQNLIALPGTRKEDIKKIYSHIQALEQSSNYLKSLDAEKISYPNTAMAAKLVKESGDKTMAAIGSLKTAEIYGLEVIDENINNSDLNTTRFAVVSKKRSSNGDKFGLLLVVNNSAGSLATAINEISKTGLNMTCLRSRALKDLAWEYYFYVEVTGDLNSKACQDMLDGLKKVCQSVRVLGSYQKLGD
ncbi:MAG: chorismate mutase [Erysipelotrichaceae bacterium]|nr:chorismate mutase [Erysipelotrichaceae bacterium]